MTGFAADVLTLYPEMFPGPLGVSLAGRALGEGGWSLRPTQIRDFAEGRHRNVDDTPAGGGPGMVMRADVLARAVDAVSPPDDPRPRLLMTPRGAPLKQARVRELAAGPGVVIVCGRFEGVDERLIGHRRLEEVSIGDYVLSGGEVAAIVLLDAVVRLLPGVMGNDLSGITESFEEGLLEHAQYTRPPIFEDEAIPQVLLSGDHGKVDAWRRADAERVTTERRPDLWSAHLAAKGRK
ncbi:tRNA (guanine-N(1)-)-methyltransferase [Pleomorphomonas sp. T1.2MG-36]|uniref:tRNA (guanosine(37)-N1)-methyltransferase TrmD n=1 Tax=Pleomorphomonas sp. T1.2MG-36 TaxID=3041167 RepID=UPI0024776009|nr:tRNA (guanosine(37)-N1)-methyltransferase TrmD [Pleomorphomonas sp. T1.2MG-36]CAI9414673.1 tRNA (guanine-N(1)-)-methyltransferase [Pleomorphomonas sp. T1.2MG-36]